MASGWAVCQKLFGIRSLYLVGTLVGGVGVHCPVVTLILTFDLALITLSLKFLSALYLRNSKVQDVDTW